MSTFNEREMMTKMKYTVLSIGILLLVGCSDFLDRQPLDEISTTTFYTTADEAELAARSMYSAIQAINWKGKSWMIEEIPSDNTTPGGNDPDFSPIDNFTVNADNPVVLEYWTEHYRLVALTNQVLTYVPPIIMDETQQNAILGEAAFLRAYAYFDLVRIFGEVPIVTEVPSIDLDLNVSRASVDDVYDFIVSDLEDAIAMLPATRSSSDNGRATSHAARALLAKVFVTIGRYEESMELCREVINSGNYRLEPDFADNWLRDRSDNNIESVWQIQYVGCGPGNTGNALQAFFAPWGQALTGNTDGWGSQIPTAPSIDNPTTTIQDVYSSDDLRRYHTIMTAGDYYPMVNADKGGYTYPAAGASRGQTNIKKYVIGAGADVCFMSTPQNQHAIRYADVLLTLAEASCRFSGGITVTPDVLEAFNAVRLRAGLETASNVTIDMVFDERRAEFAFENQRWFDLLRTGNVKEIMQVHGKQFQDHSVLFPIPAAEIDVNPNLTQNPGY
jgi:tetratricopeptide (TPR) repeat protein